MSLLQRPRPLMELILSRSRERVNAVNWQQRKMALRNLPGKYRRLAPPAIANPEQRDEPYDMFYRLPRSGELPAKRPNTPKTVSWPDLPLYERDHLGVTEPYTFFQRAGKTRKIPLFGSGLEIGDKNFPAVPIGPRKNVDRPFSVRRGTIHLRASNVSQGYVDPSTSRSFKRFSGQTDLKPISGRGGSTVNRWDGKIRNQETKKDWRSSKPSGGNPPESSYRDPYCFLI